MSGHTWSLGNPYGPICEVCGVALGTEFADTPCPGSKNIEIEQLKAKVAELEGELKGERNTLEAESRFVKKLQAQLDRATKQAQALKESTASALQVLRADREELYRELRESQDGDRATKPRPMSEMPRGGSEFWGIVPMRFDPELSARRLGDRWRDRDGDVWNMKDHNLYFIGWLPATTTAAGGSECRYDTVAGLDELDATQLWRCSGCGDETGMPMSGRRCRGPGGSEKGE